jgi:hypothetical protein
MFLGHQAPSWTAVYMSPFTCVHVDFKSWSKLKLGLKKEFFSLIIMATEVVLTLGKKEVKKCLCWHLLFSGHLLLHM